MRHKRGYRTVRSMPVHPSSIRTAERVGVPCPKRYTWAAFDAHGPRHQALRFHGQSIKQLAERGGLSFREAIAVLEKRDYFELWGWETNTDRTATKERVEKEIAWLVRLGAFPAATE